MLKDNYKEEEYNVWEHKMVACFYRDGDRACLHGLWSARSATTSHGDATSDRDGNAHTTYTDQYAYARTSHTNQHAYSCSTYANQHAHSYSTYANQHTYTRTSHTNQYSYAHPAYTDPRAPMPTAPRLHRGEKLLWGCDPDDR